MYKDFKIKSEGKIDSPFEFGTNIDINTNLFFVELGGNNENIIASNKSQADLAKMMIKSINMPDITFEDLNIFKGGYEKTFAGSRTIGDFEITSYNDINSETLNFWNNWINYIFVGKKGLFDYRSFPDEYKLNISIEKLGRTNYKTISKYNLIGVYPKNLSGLNLDKSGESAPLDFVIGLSVDQIKFEITEKKETEGEVELLKLRSDLKNLDKEMQWQVTKGKLIDTNTLKDKMNLAGFARARETIQEKLKRSAQEILKQAAREFEKKIRARIPHPLDDISFLDWQKNIQILYDAIEGYTRNQILKGINELTSIGGRKSNISISWDEPTNTSGEIPEISWDNPTNTPAEIPDFSYLLNFPPTTNKRP